MLSENSRSWLLLFAFSDAVPADQLRDVKLTPSIDRNCAVRNCPFEKKHVIARGALRTVGQVVGSCPAHSGFALSTH